MRWKPPDPQGEVIRFVRATDENPSRVVGCGIVEGAVRGIDEVRLHGSAPESLLASLPLPYEPPRATLAMSRDGFDYWWRQLIYVFDLPDPRSFASYLDGRLDGEGLAAARRFVEITRHLAASRLMNYGGAMSTQVDHASESAVETVDLDVPGLDVQAGFSALLRQCDSDDEAAGYRRVKNALWIASDGDSRTEERREMLRSWGRAVRSLRRRSLNQLVRDAYVGREGWRAFAYEEELAPDVLLRLYNYGDLIHWGDHRDEVASFEEDSFEAAHRRMAFLSAAIGLAHVYAGFGELVRASMTPPGSLLVPE